MPGAKIKKGAKVYYSIVAEDAVIEPDAKVGEIPELLEKPEEVAEDATEEAAEEVVEEAVEEPATDAVAEPAEEPATEE